MAKILKRKKYQGFCKFIAATNKTLYKKNAIKNIGKIFINQNKNKKQYVFKKLNNNRLKFKILLNFARRTLNISNKNQQYCL